MNMEKARKLLGLKNGESLISCREMILFEDGDDTALIDGHFTADQLEAIAFLMRPLANRDYTEEKNEYV